MHPTLSDASCTMRWPWVRSFLQNGCLTIAQSGYYVDAHWQVSRVTNRFLSASFEASAGSKRFCALLDCAKVAYWYWMNTGRGVSFMSSAGVRRPVDGGFR